MMRRKVQFRQTDWQYLYHNLNIIFWIKNTFIYKTDQGVNISGQHKILQPTTASTYNMAHHNRNREQF